MGGNVFSGTTKIKREDIQPTLERFYEQLGKIFPKAQEYFKEIRFLGSAGKKEYSGDIDLAIPNDIVHEIGNWEVDHNKVLDLFAKFKKRARTATDEQILKKSIIICIADIITESNTDIIADSKSAGAGALFCCFPQFNEKGEKSDDHVQIDLHVGEVEWLQFAYYSNTYKGVVKGLHRTQLMLALFSNKGYIFNHNFGVKDKDTHKVVADTPDKAVKLLNSLYDLDLDLDILSDYFKLMDVLREVLPKQELHKIFDILVKILDNTRTDIPEDLQEYWIKKQEELDLKGKFLPESSQLICFRQLQCQE